MWEGWTENGTTLIAPHDNYSGILMGEWVSPKPTKKNTSVEKKVKRAGWLKQFFEK
jgi:hypothetical protein